ncbi:unnamed protein product [Fusarium equiseti]|uniref:HNH nuclease domain-containing protein n=1 Tax=Fusarium equiseti TaxID=61235 RepID=A0A8J2NFL2_FUSEQ|nr:unnamed protein product [Fusarium equiseti]
MNIPTEPMDTEPMDTGSDTPFALPLHRVAASFIGFSALPAHEAEERYQCALELQKHIQRTNKKFHLRLDHAVAIMLADLQQLKKGGRLWAGPSCRVPPYLMEKRLNAISPLCRHYMFHLDPKNLGLPIWRHAVPMPLSPQLNPEDVPWDDGVDAYEKAVAYQARFKTKSNLQRVPLDKQRMEEAECRKRHENKCVVTGELNPRILWIIPSTWNDTVENMNATGDLQSGCLALTGIDLLDEPNPPCSAVELGTTHESWNMLPIDPVLYNYLVDGWCAFKYLFHKEEDDNSNSAKVTLEFHWMPKLAPIFIEEMDFRENWATLCENMGQFEDCRPPHGLEYGQLRDKSGDLLESGYRIDIPVPRQYVHQFVSGIKVHWAFIRFMSLFGATGRPWVVLDDDAPSEEEHLLEVAGNLLEEREGSSGERMVV